MTDSEKAESYFGTVFMIGLAIGALGMLIFLCNIENNHNDDLRSVRKCIPVIQMNSEETKAYRNALSDYALGNEKPLHMFFTDLSKRKQGKLTLKLPEKVDPKAINNNHPVPFQDPHLIWYDSETLVLVDIKQ